MNLNHALRHWVGNAEQCDLIRSYGREYSWELDPATMRGEWLECMAGAVGDIVAECVAAAELDDPADDEGRIEVSEDAASSLRAALLESAERLATRLPLPLNKAITLSNKAAHMYDDCECSACMGDARFRCPRLALRDAAWADAELAVEHAIKHDLPRTWILREEGYDYGEFTGTRQDAIDEAKSNVERDNYPDATGTIWIDVSVRCEATDEEWSGSVTLDEPEPDCHPGYTHEWIAPHWLVGGIRENPGVQGHGGGVVIREACRHCGCERVTDTWAQRPDTGEQGLTSVGYTPGEYAEALREHGEEEARDADLDSDDDDACEGHGRLWCEGYRETMAERRDEDEDT